MRSCQDVSEVSSFSEKWSVHTLIRQACCPASSPFDIIDINCTKSSATDLEGILHCYNVLSYTISDLPGRSKERAAFYDQRRVYSNGSATSVCWNDD
jgi:hypothetical protein